MSDLLVRQLLPEEWQRLLPFYLEQGASLPPPETAVIAEYKGHIVGLFALNVLLHAGPVWVAREWRGQGISDRMGQQLDELARATAFPGYLMLPSNPHSARLAVRLGLEPTGCSVYQRKF